MWAASYYPGGSDIDPSSRGFSWKHNYWCELLAPVAVNGERNTARPLALAAMAVLIVSLVLFWMMIPALFRTKKLHSGIIRTAGTSSMLVVPVMFFELHDTVMNIAGLLGCIAILLVLVNLYVQRYWFLFWAGILCLLLCGLNNYIYYTGHYMYYLPVIQKITFLIFLAWFGTLSVMLYRH